jgi:hypothetical protein
MDDARATRLRIRQAAFALAERMDWHEIGLGATGAQAGIRPVSLMQYAHSKASILQDFARDIDAAMVLLFEKYPPEGSPHDRLFDVILKRLEIMQPYKRVIASVLMRPLAQGSEGLRLFQSVTETVDWMVNAARVEAEPAWQGLGRFGLSRAYLKVLSAWSKDEDPGLARTMAALDRALRDAERLNLRAGSLFAVASGFASATLAFARQFFEERKKT